LNKCAVFHEAKSRWAYAADKDTLHIRLRTGRGDVRRVTLIATDPFNWFPDGKGGSEFDRENAIRQDMTPEYNDELFDYWFCSVKGYTSKRLRYTFILESSNEQLRFGSQGFDWAVEPDFKHFLNWFNFPFINEEDIYSPPKWAEETVWYQIFCDRFARAGGDETGKKSKLPAWGEKVEVLHRTLFGGNLKGVTEKLPYIAGLGLSGIYFTPIFESPSTHKYDTTDYFKIDPLFGTNEEFGELVKRAHDLGIRVMLDAVFNHCGFGHPFFQDAVKKGKKSKYFSYFHISKEPVLNFKPQSGNTLPQLTKEQMKDLPFLTFAYTPHMPKWNTADPGAREYLIKAARYWVEEYDIDGWRLDVSNEVSHDFWRELRKEVKSVKSDVFLLGENWDDSYPWLMGDQFDSTMDYNALSAINGYINGGLDAEGFAATLTRGVLVPYPKPLQRVLFSMLENHDTDRIMNICNGNAAAVKLGYLIQMTLSGSPSVYYGGEIGMSGLLHGGTNRSCMPWDENVPAERDFRPLIKKLTALRKKHPSFRSEDIAFLECSGGLLVYTKRSSGERLFVVINRNTSARTTILPDGSYTDLMTGKCVPGGKLKLSANEFALLLQ